jgi:ADP-ribose pyrophosphatase YjhB (NUDIX family)
MIKRGQEPMKGWWAIPAGYLDWDESMEECAIRELKEETGLEGSIERLLGVYSERFRASEEVEEIEWFGLDELPERVAFDHRKMIEDYLAGGR